MPLEIPPALQMRTTPKVWGISDISLLLGADARRHNDWSLVRHAYDLEVLRTNEAPEWIEFQSFLDELSARWLPDPITDAIRFVTPDDYRAFIAGATYYAGGGGVQRVFHQAIREYENPETESPIKVQRAQIDGVTDRDTIRLLHSVGFLEFSTNEYLIPKDVVAAIERGESRNSNQAAWALTSNLVERVGVDVDEETLARIVEEFGFSEPESKPTERGSLPAHLFAQSISDFVDELLSDGFSRVIEEIEQSIESQIAALEKGLSLPSEHNEAVESVSWPLPDSTALVCACASQFAMPVAADWVCEESEYTDIFELHQALTQMDINVHLNGRMLEFDIAYEAPTSVEGLTEEYHGWLSGELRKLRNQRSGIRRLVREVNQLETHFRHELRSSALSLLADVPASPITFAYTMLDPEHLNEFSKSEYVGDSAALEDELEQIRAWREDEPHDARPFRSLIPEVLSYPLENEDVTDEIRVMSPWFNMELENYVALFTRLLESDVKVKLLFRLPSPSKWKKIQSNFLEDIGDVENLKMRTYSRYKSFMPHHELREKEDSNEYLDEFGTHAKMCIAGSPEKGKVLNGSANLIDNSLHYNPEAGVQSQHPSLIRTAISYFDLIWGISEPDKISDTVKFREVPNRIFFPKVYRS